MLTQPHGPAADAGGGGIFDLSLQEIILLPEDRAALDQGGREDLSIVSSDRPHKSQRPTRRTGRDIGGKPKKTRISVSFTN